jgi:hypothetical protein
LPAKFSNTPGVKWISACSHPQSVQKGNCLSKIFEYDVE